MMILSTVLITASAMYLIFLNEKVCYDYYPTKESRMNFIEYDVQHCSFTDENTTVCWIDSNEKKPYTIAFYVRINNTYLVYKTSETKELPTNTNNTLIVSV